jgi:hypothetical protein
MQRETATCEMKGLHYEDTASEDGGRCRMVRDAAWGWHAPYAQAPATTEDAVFAVASVKPNKSGDQRVLKNEPGGGLTTSDHVCWARLEAVSRRPVDREIEAHLDLLADDHVRHGLSLAEARAAARREFGGVDQVKEVCRDARGLRIK